MVLWFYGVMVLWLFRRNRDNHQLLSSHGMGLCAGFYGFMVFVVELIEWYFVMWFPVV